MYLFFYCGQTYFCKEDKIQLSLQIILNKQKIFNFCRLFFAGNFYKKKKEKKESSTFLSSFLLHKLNTLVRAERNLGLIFLPLSLTMLNQKLYFSLLLNLLSMHWSLISLFSFLLLKVGTTRIL